MTNKIRRPKSVNVFGIKFTIEYPPDLRDTDGSACCGITDGPDHRIQICSTLNQTQEQVDSTLLHEICHAALYLTGHTEILGEKQEEALVLMFENALAPLYRRRFQ